MNNEIKMDHVGIAVRSIQEALPFYKTLGLLPSFEYIPSEKVKVACLILENGVSVELLEPTNSTSVIDKFLNKRGPGLHHICFRVKSLKTTLEILKKKGIKLIDQKPHKGAGGCLVAFVHPHATNGVLVELSEKLKESKSNVCE